MSLAQASSGQAKQVLQTLLKASPAIARPKQHQKPSTAHFTKLLSTDPSTTEIEAALRRYTQAAQPLTERNLSALARHTCFSKQSPETLRKWLEQPVQFGAVQPIKPVARELVRSTAAQVVRTKKGLQEVWRVLAVLAMREPTVAQDLVVLGTTLWALNQVNAPQEELKELAEQIAAQYRANKQLTDIKAEEMDTAAAWRCQLDYTPLSKVLTKVDSFGLSVEVEGMLKKLQKTLDQEMGVWRSINGSIGRRWEDYLA
ncbi:hypothetical protein BCR37DRAFT_101166 [Protomyces lactucae-debilis]|uniref:Uncharacterized protein n=1 Tax=Protomyces lactucae-debilis TaxID=2754530 RepID=A0A1Y2F553_PROLT|nr:uncharacterized protein BCR37DRAFT_101166 [Protomyces lactucae-debilis]ORY79012.1 hypothetical protein BCR37DRAFT_101166 [Protomyces lactucae-debilis]